MDLINLSAEPLGKLHSWLPHGLCAQAVVFLPDACPGKSPLPTGTAVLAHQPDWRRSVLLPYELHHASLRTEGPSAYRDLDDCLGLIEGYVEVVARFSVIGYMGHL